MNFQYLWLLLLLSKNHLQWHEYSLIWATSGYWSFFGYLTHPFQARPLSAHFLFSFSFFIITLKDMSLHMNFQFFGLLPLLPKSHFHKYEFLFLWAIMCFDRLLKLLQVTTCTYLKSSCLLIARILKCTPFIDIYKLFALKKILDQSYWNSQNYDTKFALEK